MLATGALEMCFNRLIDYNHIKFSLTAVLLTIRYITCGCSNMQLSRIITDYRLSQKLSIFPHKMYLMIQV